jgi:hypothetical protein
MFPGANDTSEGGQRQVVLGVLMIGLTVRVINDYDWAELRTVEQPIRSFAASAADALFRAVPADRGTLERHRLAGDQAAAPTGSCRPTAPVRASSACRSFE